MLKHRCFLFEIQLFLHSLSECSSLNSFLFSYYFCFLFYSVQLEFHLYGSTTIMDDMNVTVLDALDYQENGNSSDWTFEVTFEFIVHGILINSIGVLGLLGNIFSIVVLSRPQMKSSINTLLIGLVRNYFLYFFLERIEM